MTPEECPCTPSGFHRWHYASMNGVTLRKCEGCGKKEACFTEQVFLVWGHVPEGYCLLNEGDDGE